MDRRPALCGRLDKEHLIAELLKLSHMSMDGTIATVTKG